MVRTSNPLIKNTSSAEGTSAGGTSAEGTSAEGTSAETQHKESTETLTSVKIKFRRLLSIQRKSMLSFLTASAAEFLRLLIFVFDLDLFVEIINPNHTLKITTIASTSPYTFPYAEKLNFSILRKNRLMGPK